MRQDLSYAFRAFAKNPAFTLIAVMTIALGVGPNSAVFSIVNAVLLRPLPYRDSDRIVILWETNRKLGFNMMPVSAPNFADWQRDSRSFEEMAPAFTIPEYGFNVTAGGEPERAQAGQAAWNLFSVLGVQPALGRAFLPEEDRPGGNPVVLISHSFWKRRFGASPSIIGRSIGLDGVNRTVVGVLPREVESLGKVDVWIPIGRNLALDPRNNHNFGILARLKPGVTARQAQAELDGIARRLEREYPATNAGMGALVVPINELLTGLLRPALLILLAAVTLLLLIACANVANLLLARGNARRKEIAVRVAIGASRGRILRQLLTESVLLGVAGGLLGLLLSAWSVGALRSQLPDIIPRLKEMGLDSRVVLFTVAISSLTGILFGLAPAVRASKTDLNETLKEGGGKGVGGDSSQRPRNALLIAEVALSMLLLVGAGLLIRSFVRINSVDPGFQPDRLLTMQLTLPNAKYPKSSDGGLFAKNALRRVQGLPGVQSAAAVNIMPARGSFINLRTFIMPFHIDGEPPAIAGQEPTADYRCITPAFLRAMGIPLRSGRMFTEQDTADKQRVILVNETMVRRYFHGVDPVGRRLRMPSSTSDPRVIVGVIGDIRMQGLESKIEPAVYVPFEQEPVRQFSVLVRSSGDPAALAAAVRREILAIDPDQPVSDVRTMTEVLANSLLVRRLAVWMLGAFAALALILALVGIYGLTSYSISRRRQEIGIRMALGASQQQIVRMLVRRGIALALAGIAIGLPLSFLLSKFMRALLFGIAATDTATFVIAPLLILCAAAVASYIPARRAMKIDPLVALRYE